MGAVALTLAQPWELLKQQVTTRLLWYNKPFAGRTGTSNAHPNYIRLSILRAVPLPSTPGCEYPSVSTFSVPFSRGPSDLADY